MRERRSTTLDVKQVENTRKETNSNSVKNPVPQGAMLAEGFTSGTTVIGGVSGCTCLAYSSDVSMVLDSSDQPAASPAAP